MATDKEDIKPIFGDPDRPSWKQAGETLRRARRVLRAVRPRRGEPETQSASQKQSTERLPYSNPTVVPSNTPPEGYVPTENPPWYPPLREPIVLEHGQEFNPNEDLYKGLRAKVLVPFLYILPEQECIQAYLRHRNITDVSMLVARLDEAKQRQNEKNERINKKMEAESKFPLLYEPLPESGSPAMQLLVNELQGITRIDLEVEVLKYLVQYNANRKGIFLDETFHPHKEPKRQ